MTSLSEQQTSVLDVNGNFENAEAVALTGGGYVIAANVLDYANDGGQYPVEQFFDASGALVNTVNLRASGGTGGADGLAAALPNGDVITAIEGLPGVTAQIATPAGAVVHTGASFGPPSGGGALDPGGIAVLSGGDTIVTLNEPGGAMFSGTQQLYFQLVDNQGFAVRSPTPITGASGGNSDTASVAAMESDQFVVTWTAYGSAFAQVWRGQNLTQASSVINLGSIASTYGPVPTAAGLSDGGFVVDWLASDGLHLQHFDHSGVSVDAPIVIPGATLTDGDWGSHTQTVPDIAALPGGGYVVAWDQINADGTNQVMGARINAADQMVGSPFAVSDVSADAKSPNVAVGSNGAVLFTWIDNVKGGAIESNYHGAVMTKLVDFSAVPPPAGETLTSAGPATILSASAGWTSAMVTPLTHTLAVVSATAGDYGSHVATEQAYDASGNETGSAALAGYAGANQTLTPEITALTGGFYQVNYAASSDYEVYSAGGTAVFTHNQYTSPTAGFTGLSDGDYVVTDSASNVFGLFNSGANNLGWISVPADAPSAPTARALNGGGFVFTYAGSSHFDVFDASGNLTTAGDLGATASSFATGFAALASPGAFAEAWLSPDGGQNGLATSLDFQLISAAGNPAFPAITLTQDLDPWHTTIALQAHDDGSAAILWSEGGGVFGAEYSGGSVGPVHAAFAGDLSTTTVVQLPGDQVGLAYLQNGDVWAELFNPSTGAVQRADLGAATGDISTVHALATANGGMAVSWHDASGVLGAVLSASGQTGGAISLPGDLLGVDAMGHAVTLHDQGGTPVLQTYAISDGLFWVH